MGEDVAGHRKHSRKRPSLEGVLLVDTFEVIAPFYGLRNGADFHDLTEKLVFLSCVYQEITETVESLEEDGVVQSSRRTDGHRLAMALRDEAAGVLQSLSRIDDKVREFDLIVRDHPPLLSAIFTEEAGQVQSLSYPPALAILKSFFNEVDWEAAVLALGRLAALPVREKLARGPMENVTLRRAVVACRAYWRDVEGHSWSMSSLKNKNVRDVNDPRNLQGQCEAFVSDVLTQCGIMHGLQDLCSAWTAVDQAKAHA